MNDPDKEIGFDANRIGFGRRAGIIIIDLKKAFTDARFPLGGRPMVERAVNNTVKLLALCRGVNRRGISRSRTTDESARLR